MFYRFAAITHILIHDLLISVVVHLFLLRSRPKGQLQLPHPPILKRVRADGRYMICMLYIFSHHHAEKKIAELQHQLKATQEELASEKSQHDSFQRLHEQQSKQQQSKIYLLEQENSLLRQQSLLDKEQAESQTRRIELQLQDKDAAILQLEVSCNMHVISECERLILPINHVQESLIEMRQQVNLLQENVQEMQLKHSLFSAQRDAEITDVQRQKQSLASSEAALEAAQQQLRNAHLEIEVSLDDWSTTQPLVDYGFAGNSRNASVGLQCTAASSYGRS